MANKVTVNIGSKFNERGVDDAKQSLKGLEPQGKATGASLSAGFAVATAGAVALVAVLVKVAKSVSAVVDAYKEQESAERRLKIAARNNPLINGDAERALRSYAAELERTTMFGDEAIIQQQQFLVALGYSEEQIRSVIDAAVNLASTGMVTLESAVRNVSKTLGGMTGELGELIPGLKSLTKAELEAGKGIEYIREQFAGMAAEMRAETTGGSMSAFTNAWGTLKEIMGGFAENIIRPIRNELTWTMETIAKMAGGVDDLAKSLDELDTSNKAQRAFLLETITERRAELARAEARLAELMAGGEAKTLYRINEDGTVDKSQGVTIPVEVQTRTVQEQIERLKEDIAKALAIAAEEGIDLGLEESDKQLSAAAARWARIIGPYFKEASGVNMTFGELLGTIEATELAINDLVIGLTDAGKRSGLYTDQQIVAMENMLEYYEERLAKLNAILEREKEIAGVMARPNWEFPAGTGEIQHGRPLPGTEGTEETLGTIIAAAIGDPTELVIQMLTEFAEKVQSVSAIINGLSTIISAWADTLGPAIDAILIPVVGILRLLGQTIGQLLQPLLEAIAPVISDVVDAFIFLWNQAIMPVGNLLWTLGQAVSWLIDSIRTAIHNLGEIIAHPFRASKRDMWTGSTLTDFIAGKGGPPLREITRGALEDYGALDDVAMGGGGIHGGSTSVIQAPDIYVTNHFDGVFIGAGGMEQVGGYVNEALESFVNGGGTPVFVEA